MKPYFRKFTYRWKTGSVALRVIILSKANFWIVADKQLLSYFKLHHPDKLMDIPEAKYRVASFNHENKKICDTLINPLGFYCLIDASKNPYKMKLWKWYLTKVTHVIHEFQTTLTDN
jgi:hypothetical protein